MVWSSIHDIAVFDEPFHVWSHGLFGAARNDCFNVEHDSDTMASRNVVRHGQVLSFGELLKQPGWCDAQFTFVGGRIRALQCAALCQPHLVLSLMLQQRWTPLSIGGKVLTAIKEKHVIEFLTGQRHFRLPEGSGTDDVSRVSFEPRMFERAARLLRQQQEIIEDESEDIGRIDKKDVLAWLDEMGSHTKDALGSLMQAGSGLRHGHDGKEQVMLFKMEALMQSLLLCQVLRNDAFLAQAVEHSGILLGFNEGWMEDHGGKVPSKSTLSTRRFMLDCGYAVLVRNWLQGLLNSGRHFFIYLLADSSPRAGREWLLIEYYLVFADKVDGFLEAMRELVRMRLEGVDDVLKMKRLSERMHEAVWHHILIPVALGAKNMGLAAKWAAIMHALHIEAFTWAMVRALVRCCVCLTTDYGTESEIGIVPAFDPRQLSTAWSESCIVDDSADNVDLSSFFDDATISFSEVFRIPGTDHIIHNALDQVTDHLVGFKEWFTKAKALGKFLGSRYYVDRFVAACLNVQGGEHIKTLVQGEVMQPYEKRFGSIMGFLMDVLPMRHGLQTFVDERVYNSASGRARDEDEEVFVDISHVALAIASHEWWGYAIMLVALGAGLHGLRSFSRSCPCHSKVGRALSGVVSYYRWRKEEDNRSYSGRPCPGRGLRGPEFACGAPEEIIQTSFSTYSEMLLQDLLKLVREARDRIMADFDIGVQHCKYVVSVKFAVWKQLPLCLIGIAHFDPGKATQAARRSLEQFKIVGNIEGMHSVVKRLFAIGSATRDAIEAVAMGTPVHGLVALKPYIVQWSMMRVNELSVERLHKLGSVVARRAPFHSGAVLSCTLRVPEIARKPHAWSLQALAEACYSVRNELCVIKEFQLDQHRALQHRLDQLTVNGKRLQGGHAVHAVVRSIFYRCDLPTMFDPFKDLTDAIKASKAAFKQALDVRLANPLAAAQAIDADESLKVDGFQTHYAMQHFKAC